jgi:uncharacterized protein YndB with AHSA1/START domain
MKVAIVEAEVDIDRSPEDVFDYCSDHAREPEWNPMMKRIERITDGPIGVGTRYSTQFARGPAMEMECTRYERPTHWSVVGESAAMKVGGENKITPTARGAHLAMRMEIEPRGSLRWAMPLMRRRLDTQFQRDLENIKAILEKE